MSKISIRIDFGPDDLLNPECGFYFKAESRKGVEMLTHCDPDTGEPLDAHGCIKLAQTFFGPDPKQEPMIYVDRLKAVLDDYADYDERGNRSLCDEIRRHLLGD